jgi:hypothetical protein
MACLDTSRDYSGAHSGLAVEAVDRLPHKMSISLGEEQPCAPQTQ